MTQVPDINTAQEIFIDGVQYFTSCTVVREKDRTKTVLRTAERAEYLTLTDAAGRIWGEVSNLSEPYDFTTHVFYLPDEALTQPMTVRFVNRAKKSAYFASRGQRGIAALMPDRIEHTTLAAFIAETDHHITPEHTEDTEICTGVYVRRLDCRNAAGAPVRMFALFADPRLVTFSVGTANDGYAAHDAIQTVRGQAEAATAAGSRVVAAVNADFFDMFGDCAPSGICVKHGRTVANGQTLRSFFGVTLNGTPVISSFAEEPTLMGQLSCAAGGREIFLRDGELAELSPCEPFSSIGHPRTAVGILADGNVVFLVVDGRIPELSAGASLVDLARVMQSFGAVRAINLDGGGSSTLLGLRDGELALFNRPADLHRPLEPLIREIYNSVQIIAK